MSFLIAWFPLTLEKVVKYASFPCIFIDGVLLTRLLIIAEGFPFLIFFFRRRTRVIVTNSVLRKMSRRTETPKAAQMPITAALLREALLAEVEKVVGTTVGGGEEGVDKVVESDGEGKEPAGFLHNTFISGHV